MFNGSVGLTDASDLVLDSDTLSQGCYSGMFQGCTSLTTAPALPATALANSCYTGMFRNCTSLTTAPALPATTLPKNSSCYNYMFTNCQKLSSVEVAFDAWPSGTLDFSYPTYNWLSGVASSGNFICHYGLDTSIRDASHIPVGWNVVYTDVPESVLSGAAAAAEALTMING